jgi:hypothetical protein
MPILRLATRVRSVLYRHKTPFLIFLAICFTALRRLNFFTSPKLWAEDGLIFWSDSRRFPIWQTIFHPYVGYLHVIPRILAAITAVFPIGATPVLYTALAIVVTSLSCALVLRAEMKWLIPSYWVRAFVFAALVVLPGAGSEISGNLSGIQEYLAIGLLILALSQDPESRRFRIFLMPLVVAMALTGPFAPILVLAFWLRVWRNRTRYSTLIAIVVTISSVVVEVVNIATQGGGHSLLWRIFNTVHADWYWTIHNSVLGTLGSLTYGRAILIYIWGTVSLHSTIWLGCLVLLFLVIWCCRHLPWTVVASFLIALLGVIVAVNDRVPGGWISMGGGNLGNRYYALPVAIVILIVGIAISKSLDSQNRLHQMLSLAPGVVISMACVLSMPLGPLPDVQWSQSVSCLDTAKVCTVQIDPRPWTVYMSTSPAQLQEFCRQTSCSGEHW